MTTATKPATATLRRIGISRRVQLRTDGRFFGELRQDDDGLRWSGRIWLPSHDDRPGRGSVVGEWSSGDMTFAGLLMAAESCIAWHIDSPVKIEPKIEADGYYSPTMLESYPHLARDQYLAAAVYDRREKAVVMTGKQRLLVSVGATLLHPQHLAEPCREWERRCGRDTAYLAWLVSEKLKADGESATWVKSLTR